MIKIKMNNTKAKSPNTDFGLFSRDLENFFGDFFNVDIQAQQGTKSWSPRADVFEDDKIYQISLDLPGIPKGDVEIHFEEDVLTISGERKHKNEDEGRKYFRVEKRYGEFKRTFSFRKAVDSKKIKAEFKDGVLSVQVPKSAETKARQIKIQ